MGQFNLTTATNLFKIKYEKLSDNVYNSDNVVWARIKKVNNFTGKRKEVAIPKGFGGGVGSGTLPTANYAKYEDALITRKKVYSVIEVDREAIKASQDDEGAFVRLTKEAVAKGVESCMRNLSRILFNDGSGKLGTTSAADATGTAADPVIIITAATWKEANWEEQDFVNVGTTSDVFEVITVAPSTRTITLNRVSGSTDITAGGAGTTKAVYMQNSKDLDPSGLKGVCDAVSSTLYSVNVGRRWQAYQVAAAGAGVTEDLMVQMCLQVKRRCGKSPNLIVSSFVQYQKILNFMEDKKTISVEPRLAELKGKISYKAVALDTVDGEVPIVVDRFVEDDRIYFLNDNYITVHNAPGWGWFDDDGTIFLRTSGDAYGARYGGYCEIYIPPSFHGVVTGLAV